MAQCRKTPRLPLVIIDGVEYESVNDLRLINPSDIESMNFLGTPLHLSTVARAAGGVVVLITTASRPRPAR